MGLSLSLVPEMEFAAPGLRLLGYTRLPFDYYTDVIQQAVKPYVLPLDVELMWYGDEGIEYRKTDPYGAPLEFINAGHLVPILHQTLQNLPQNAQRRAAELRLLAAARFVETLSPNTRVVLYWH